MKEFPNKYPNRSKPPIHQGKNNHRWNGGKTKDKHGYIKILKPNHPMSDSKGYVYKHRFIMSEAVGRILTRQDVVHHIDGNITNNSIKNLQLMTHKEHKSLHGKKQSNLPLNKKYKKECCVCNTIIYGGNRLKYCKKCRT